MSTDRELLELASKAAGIYLEWDGHPEKWQPMYYEGKTYHSWEPLTDDGDALRLAVTLKLDLLFFDGYQEIMSEDQSGAIQISELYGNDMHALARRAIVRAAAELGRLMP